MEATKAAVVSKVGNELKLLTGRDRGTRYWSSVEIQGERWFQVETCRHDGGIPEVKSLFAVDLWTARQLVRRYSDYTWTTVRLYTRLPLLRPEGFVFETVTQAFQFSDGSLLYMLESGLMLRDGAGKSATGDVRLADAKELYSDRRGYIPPA